MSARRCFDLWSGVECSSSGWPGTDDCKDTRVPGMISCSDLGWATDVAGYEGKDVCGSSALVAQSGSDDECV